MFFGNGRPSRLKSVSFFDFEFGGRNAWNQHGWFRKSPTLPIVFWTASAIWLDYPVFSRHSGPMPLGISARKQPLSHPAKFSTVGLRAPRRIHTIGQKPSLPLGDTMTAVNLERSYVQNCPESTSKHFAPDGGVGKFYNFARN